MLCKEGEAGLLTLHSCTSAGPLGLANLGIADKQV